MSTGSQSDAGAGARRRDERRVDADQPSRRIQKRPPELPGLIAVSVWITFDISRPLLVGSGAEAR